MVNQKDSLRKYDRVASFYDTLHHIQTLWADDIHRKKVLNHSDLHDGQKVLDVGTGTGRLRSWRWITLI